MSFISEFKSTYNFAKGELRADIKRNPTLTKGYNKIKSLRTKKRSKKPIKKWVEKGRSIPTEEVFKKIKKKAPKSKYKKIKYKRKPLTKIKKETFSTYLNI